MKRGEDIKAGVGDILGWKARGAERDQIAARSIRMSLMTNKHLWRCVSGTRVIDKKGEEQRQMESEEDRGHHAVA